MDSRQKPDSATRSDARRQFLKTVLTTAAAPAAIAAFATSSQAQNPYFLPSLYRGWNARNFQEIRADENDHVEFLLGALGDLARPMPNFKNLEQSTVVSFAMVSEALENTGVGAYLGALPLLIGFGSAYTQPAATIALIEARHAGYLNTLLDQPITKNALGSTESFESPLTPEQVVTLASPFVADLNGGPPLIPPGGFTNDIQILNFALALEFLEAAFYNINVPKFL
jgi:hypothetical protein